MKVEELFERNNHWGLHGIIDRMAATVEGDPSGFRSPNLCHTVTLNYAIRQARSNDEVVFVGVRDKVLHSFVVNSADTILADSYAGQNPEWDGQTYTVAHNDYQVIKRIKVGEFLRRVGVK